MELIWVITVGQGRFPPPTGDGSSEVTDAAVLSLYRESNKFALVSHISYIYIKHMGVYFWFFPIHGLPFQENQRAYISAVVACDKSGSSIVQSLLALVSSVPSS